MDTDVRLWGVKRHLQSRLIVFHIIYLLVNGLNFSSSTLQIILEKHGEKKLTFAHNIEIFVEA